MTLDLPALQRLAARLGQLATRELLARRQSVKATEKAEGGLLTAADTGMQQAVIAELHNSWPQIPVLGEELSAAERDAIMARSQGHFWCLDPLDGTSNFASGIPYFAVSLALIEGGRVQAGLVLDPLAGEAFTALAGQGAWLNGQPLRLPAQQPTQLRDAMAMVDLKRLPPALIVQLARACPYRSQRSFGAVALDWCWLAAGRCQLYLHGGQKLWDYAAGQLIAAEAGVSGGLWEDWSGSPPTALALTPRIGVAASTPSLFHAWTDWLRTALAAQP